MASCSLKLHFRFAFALAISLRMGLPGGDLLGVVAAILFLEQADFRLDAGFHGDNLIVGQVVGTDDGDGIAARLLDPLAVESGLGIHGHSLLVGGGSSSSGGKANDRFLYRSGGLAT
jgi:hypothetical protein